MIRIVIEANDEDEAVKCIVKIVEGEQLTMEIAGLLTVVEKIAKIHKSEMKNALEIVGVDDEK